jgi:HSP20 family protein
VDERARAERARTGRAESEREGTERAGGERGTAGERGEAGERTGADERWRGSRGLFRGGGDQAFAMMRSLSREMDKLWEQVMRRAASAGRGTTSFTGAWTPAIEICERNDAMRVCAEVPGVDAQDLHVEVDPQLLVIRGERRPDNPAAANARSERLYGSFVRRIPLPDGLRTEDARASLRNGVLEVRIPVAKLTRGRDVPVETADTERSV